LVPALSPKGAPGELRSDRPELGHGEQAFGACRLFRLHHWGVKGPNFYLLNVLRKKLAFPDLKRAVREQSDLFNLTVILIEDKASGTQLIQDLLDAGLSRITRYKPDGDKIMRLHAQTATIENGFVHLPETAHWLADYLHELTMFPAGRYDDQVDSTAQALAWTKIRPPGWGIFEYYRDLVAQANGSAPERVVSLKTPPCDLMYKASPAGSTWLATRWFPWSKKTRRRCSVPDFRG
jgi:predicted phage terminase large subunit-like protein